MWSLIRFPSAAFLMPIFRAFALINRQKLGDYQYKLEDFAVGHKELTALKSGILLIMADFFSLSLRFLW